MIAHPPNQRKQEHWPAYLHLGLKAHFRVSGISWILDKLDISQERPARSDFFWFFIILSLAVCRIGGVFVGDVASRA